VTESALRNRIRFWLLVVIVGLIVAGVTAFPLDHETQWLDRIVDDPHTPLVGHLPWAVAWIDHVTTGIHTTARNYPFIAYGTDWLAFAHIMIAIAFLGPLRDPVRNIWVVQFGMIACVAIVPLALIAGPVRGIPFWWTCIDMSFGVFGIIPLVIAYRYIRRLERAEGHDSLTVHPAPITADLA
jgi:hypothetical protein